MKTYISIFLAAAMMAGCLLGCGITEPSGTETQPTEGTTPTTQTAPDPTQPPAVLGETLITLSPGGISLDGGAQTQAVYTSNDIIYYEDRDAYESGNPYGEGTASERHSAEEAAAHTVVNITAPGTYRLTGSLPLGQIRVDLGEEAFTDPAAVVTLILDNVDITCQVAPAILFLNVYECDNTWTAETASAQVDTSAAGANLVIADGSVNTVVGSHVARIYKDKEGEKKLWKQDAAVYSYMSMNVEGDTGLLDITADNEGLDTELHLTINGGNLNIRSGNDGINTNEDGVSVTTINGGNIHIIAGLGEEGDGVDSNGWLVINGGTVVASANPGADAGLDSDMGSYVNGGTVIALGSTMDWAESDSAQVTMNLQFAEYKDSGDAIVVTRPDGTVVFAYDPSEDEVLGQNVRRYMGAVISCPGFALEDVYQVWIGGSITGTEVGGVYDAQTVAGYTGGIQQAYTGTDVTMGLGGFGPMGSFGGFGGFGGGQRPEGQEPPEMPEGETMPTMPEGQEPPEMDQGWFGGRGPGGEQGQMPGSQTGGEENTLFYMQDKVNNFSGVAGIE